MRLTGACAHDPRFNALHGAYKRFLPQIAPAYGPSWEQPYNAGVAGLRRCGLRTRQAKSPDHLFNLLHHFIDGLDGLLESFFVEPFAVNHPVHRDFNRAFALFDRHSNSVDGT